MKHKTSDTRKKEHYQNMYRSGSRIIYYTTLLILTVCNFIVTLTLIPFVLTLENINVYLVAAGLGLVFGLLFNTLVRDIEHLRPKHHILAAVFIPLVALINFYLISVIISRISKVLMISVNINPLILGLIFCILFITPLVANALFRESLLKSEHF